MATTSEPNFVNPTVKLTRLSGLCDKILMMQDQLDDLIDRMVRKDPKLLCRLNFKNPRVKEKIQSLLDQGVINLADLMFTPEETAKVETKKAAKQKKKTTSRTTQRISRINHKPKKETQKRRAKKMVTISTDYNAWLDELDKHWDNSESGIFEAIC